jgi:hypothetical protein
MMRKVFEFLRREPVRVLAVLTAATAVVSRYVADFPTDLVLGLAAAVLGVGGEIARSQVTPTVKTPEG